MMFNGKLKGLEIARRDGIMVHRLQSRALAKQYIWLFCPFFCPFVLLRMIHNALWRNRWCRSHDTFIPLGTKLWYKTTQEIVHTFTILFIILNLSIKYLRDGSLYQIGRIFGKSPMRGGGGIFNPKIYIADFGPFSDVFLKKMQLKFPKMRGAGGSNLDSKAVWIFFPKIHPIWLRDPSLRATGQRSIQSCSNFLDTQSWYWMLHHLIHRSVDLVLDARQV